MAAWAVASAEESLAEPLADAPPVAVPVVDTRVDDAVGEPLWLPPREQEVVPAPEKNGWDIGLGLRAAYNDNIFLSATAPKSDFVVSVTPSIGWKHGQADQDGARLRVAYRPSAVWYLDHHDESRIDHELEVEAGIRGKQTSVSYAGAFRKLGDPTAETGAPTDRDEYASELRFAWQPRDKVAVELAAGVNGTNYDQAAYADSSSRYGEVALRYTYSPKTEVAVAYRAGTYEVDGSSDQDFQRATVRMTWKPREKWTIDVTAGVESRDFAAGSETFGVFDARVDWNLREGTTLFLSGYRREDVSAVFAGQNIEILGVRAGVSQRIGDRWTASVEAGYESADYKRISGTGRAGRSDGIVFVQPSLTYSLTERFRLGAYYRYERNDSNTAAFGYDNHQIGLDLNYDF